MPPPDPVPHPRNRTGHPPDQAGHPPDRAGHPPDRAGHPPEGKRGGGAVRRVDGRTARAERTRAAIVDAHLALIGDGELRPTADRIAERAGVSLRALWSHFADLERLFAASGERVLHLLDAAFVPVAPSLPLPARIDAYCRQRARLLEQVAPAARAAQLKEPFSAALRRHRTGHLDRVRDELGTLFAVELDAAGDGRSTLLAALTAVSSWPTWATLRDDLGLDVGAARAALAATVTALLRPAPSSPRAAPHGDVASSGEHAGRPPN